MESKFKENVFAVREEINNFKDLSRRYSIVEDVLKKKLKNPSAKVPRTNKQRLN